MQYVVSVLLVMLVLVFVGSRIDFTNGQQAQALVRVAEIESAASVQVAQTWALVTPLLLLILVAGGAVALLIYWQGRIHLERTKQAYLVPGAPGFDDALRQMADEEQAKIEVVDGTYYLVWSDERQPVAGLLTDAE